MKVDIILELKDVPGSLIRALEPISKHGGNIISVLHSRNKKELVSVQISFNIMDKYSLDLIRNSLREQRIRVSEIRVDGKRYYTKKTLTFILVGHVIDKDIRDTIDRINEIGLVSDLDVIMPSPEQKSSVMMNVDVDSKNIDKLIFLVKRICDEKDFLLVRSLE
ncbi:MAG: hypothetical protein DRO90_03455 [Candidatus Altiarchaeales archaeon]|nr:MAG: hypothetical protein DRO95_03345 [Candidatus Altiarchaeales archaeon]RLI93519.1 MAG: hypothetical protein DRO90_03455 [Candidatus Altiarchaeales archaeon]RLI94357.1 MAG: hypothetical protein DRO94_03055 [Candidatus Altiarchaeales archaeon]HDO81997.1 hypothetical protein [Candidatus Altiarchaeales archaeon]HEX54646.1 hypothetical protein [Candidatus Altiarchaeales archaeon]